MASIRSKNTKPEIMVRKFLFAHGFRFRVNQCEAIAGYTGYCAEEVSDLHFHKRMLLARA